MEVNADFDQRVVVHGHAMPWQDSPIEGVQRRMFDRVGGEVARATSIVKYAPGSQFSRHIHTGGEEFVVLEGVFQDEHGDYPQGSYIRNPPESSHTPGSADGCVIFVKLWQFDPADRGQIELHFDHMPRIEDPARPDVKFTLLYQDDREAVSIEEWPPGAQLSESLPGGAELLVLEGDFTSGDDALEVYSWLRLPAGSELDATAGESGAKVWVKRHHLRNVEHELAYLSSR